MVVELDSSISYSDDIMEAQMTKQEALVSGALEQIHYLDDQ